MKRNFCGKKEVLNFKMYWKSKSYLPEGKKESQWVFPVKNMLSSSVWLNKSLLLDIYQKVNVDNV